MAGAKRKTAKSKQKKQKDSQKENTEPGPPPSDKVNFLSKNLTASDGLQGDIDAYLVSYPYHCIKQPLVLFI